MNDTRTPEREREIPEVKQEEVYEKEDQKNLESTRQK